MDTKINKPLKAAIVLKFGSQKAHATRLGVHETLVSQVVRGRRTLSRKDQRKWARLLNTDVEAIFPEGA